MMLRIRRHRGRLAALLGLVSLATACSTASVGGRSASTLPHISASNPVVIVPGILGSKLEDARDGRVIWGKIFSLRALTVHESLVQPDYDGRDGLDLPIDSVDLRANRDHLLPSGILDRFTIIPHVAEVQEYQKMLEAFEVCGYHPGKLKSCGLQVNAAVFDYDWRRDIVENAQLLAADIRAIRANTGESATKVDLIAHSMGGLIVEYYLLYGDEDVLDREPLPPPTYAGAANIRRVILLGVPHMGSMDALKILHKGYHVGWRTISNEATFTMPSIYQLLPPSETVHLRSELDVSTDFDLYDPSAWERYELSVFSQKSRRGFLRRCKVLFPDDWRLQSDKLYTRFQPFLRTVLRRAERLHEVLAAFPAQPPGPEVFLIGSAARSTLATADVKHERNDWQLHLGSSHINPDGDSAPGDGTVTAASFTWGAFTSPASVGNGSGTAGAGFPVTWVDEKHARLPSNPDVLKSIAEILSN